MVTGEEAREKEGSCSERARDAFGGVGGRGGEGWRGGRGRV